jgi:hypothetical protein
VIIIFKIDDNLIRFLSEPDNYFKEFNGFKNNTVRRFDKDELNIFEEFKNNLNPESKIRIVCKDKNQRYDLFFDRYITDITKFEDLYIISWR